MSIIREIKKSLGGIIYAFRCLSWYFYFLKTRFLSQSKKWRVSEEWYKKGRVLLIAPHADDELLSSYTLMKHCPNITVYYCGFTGTNHEEENRRRREQEIMKVCSTLNVPMVNGKGTCSNLAEIINEYDIVVIPSIVDWHIEHRRVSYYLHDILNEAAIKPEIYSYSITVPNESQGAVIANMMSKKEQDDKYALFYKAYHSQSFMPIFRFKINERINGQFIKAYAAETFMHYPFEEWCSKTSRIRDLEAKSDGSLLDLIKSVGEINNLRKVRKASRTFYALFEQAS